jgi:hypothetical protein
MDKDETARALEHVRLMIATPCYGGQVTSHYLQSIVRLTRLATQIDLKFTLFSVDNESLITRARNRCVHTFLESDATHLMFVDADIGFSPFDVFRMLLHDEDIVVASYPKKGLDWEALVDRKVDSVLEARAITIQHVVNVASELEGSSLLEVLDAGTGFMVIKREVIDRMIEANPEWAYGHEAGGVWHAIFDCEIDDGRYLSEDYTFCRRWQRLGGKILLDPEIILTHTGSYTFGIT